MSLPEGDTDPGRRQPWREGPVPSRDGGSWMGLSDDELLYRIESLGREDEADRLLLEVVGSDRHFFIRQEAAKKIRDVGLLKDHSGDRHIGQILVRGMNRQEDVAYLRRILAESRHLEVRKAAEVQLRLLTAPAGDERQG
jgi:hypothetical protein